MEKSQWWKAAYVNTREWILDHYEEFNLSAQEGIVVLMIDFFNANGKLLTLESLAKQCNMSLDDVDRVLNILCAKRYLSIKVKANAVEFDLSGLYSAENENQPDLCSGSVFDLFESEFSRPLSNAELQRLSEWVMKYDEKLVIYALREALMYQKLSFNYINKILIEWEKKGITVSTLEKNDEGK